MYNVGDLLKHAVHGETIRITAIGQMFYGIMRDKDGSVDTFDKTYIHKYFLPLKPVTAFKVGDVIAKNDNGRLYKILEITPVGTVMMSLRSGKHYSLTEHDKYSLFTEGNNVVTECEHNWKVYNSGLTIDNYCAKCNVKKAYEGPL